MKGIHPRHTGARLHILNSVHICDNMRSNVIKHSNEFKTVGKRYEIINSSWQQEGFFFLREHHIIWVLNSYKRTRIRRKQVVPAIESWRQEDREFKAMFWYIVRTARTGYMRLCDNREYGNYWEGRPMCVFFLIFKNIDDHIYVCICVYTLCTCIYDTKSNLFERKTVCGGSRVMET